MNGSWGGGGRGQRGEGLFGCTVPPQAPIGKQVITASEKDNDQRGETKDIFKLYLYLKK